MSTLQAELRRAKATVQQLKEDRELGDAQMERLQDVRDRPCFDIPCDELNANKPSHEMSQVGLRGFPLQNNLSVVPGSRGRGKPLMSND